MHRGSRDPVPAALGRLAERFSAWRSIRKQGQRIPEPLWRAAAKLAADCGLNQTAAVLKLDYYSLKKHMDELASVPDHAPFVELPVVSGDGRGECLIEWEDGHGARMRVHVKGSAVPDVLALGRDFWNAESCCRSLPK